LELTPPQDGASKGLQPGIGMIEFDLLPETKSDLCHMAVIVIAWKPVSGFSLGIWLTRLLEFSPHIPGLLFSTAQHPFWMSCMFYNHYA
jgi:hypothetical protein